MSIIRVSNSEIQTFKRCRRKWWLSYYRNLLPKTRRMTGPLALGSRVHEALEQYYKNGIDPVAAHSETIDLDRNAMLADGLDISDLEHEAELGRVMLDGYMEWVTTEGLDSDLDILGSEQKLTLSLLDGDVELIGKIDLRVRRKIDTANSILDFKTSATFMDFTQLAHMDEQLLTYILLDSQQPDTSRVDGAIFRLLRKVKRSSSAKPPFYEQMVIRHNSFTMRSFWSRIHGVLRDLVATREALDAGADPSYVAYPTPKRDCRFDCIFQPICPLIDDGSAAEAAIEDAYTVGDPYERYESKETTA